MYCEELRTVCILYKYGVICARCQHVIQRIKDIFKKKFWDRTGAIIHLLFRLIPLDKAAPKVEKPENAFRPICVCSAIIKILEAALINKLRIYVKNNVHYSQCGFIGGTSCAHNLVRLHMLRENVKKGKLAGKILLYAI